MDTAKSLGKYEIIEELGRGGFATVYRARDPDLDREVALKVLHPTLMTDPTFVERFRREARAAGRLRHPSIVTIYEIGQVEGMLYIAMELLPGPSLAEVLRAEVPLTVEHAVTLLRPLCEALDYAHAQALVHRDLKPSNVILNTQGQPVLTDFGLVRAAEGDAASAVSLTLSQTGMTLGTPAYMAPEQCDSDAVGPVDHRADLYSLGVIAYEMLTGRVPFQGNTPLAVAMGHVMVEPPPPRKLNPALTEKVEAALGRALAKKPEARFAQAVDFVDALAVESEVSQLEPTISSPIDIPPTPSAASPTSLPAGRETAAPIPKAAPLPQEQKKPRWQVPDWSWVVGGVEVLALAMGGVVGGVVGYIMANFLGAATGYSVGGAVGGVFAAIAASIGQLLVLRRTGRKVGWWIPVTFVVQAAPVAVIWAVAVVVIWVGIVYESAGGTVGAAVYEAAGAAWVEAVAMWTIGWAVGVVVSRAILLWPWLWLLKRNPLRE